ALAFINMQQEESEHFCLNYLSVQSGGSVMATASVRLKAGDNEYTEAATGNGPVDAVYQCINRITGYEISIVNYQLSAKGQGKDALGQVDIVADYQGRRFHGVGLETDIIESSAQALIHVINAIHRAQRVSQETQRIHQQRTEAAQS
ncbi:alpha-isopropylmalate synthase regulatory domain-containing protein, partial [Plesiomonas sp.]